MTQDTGRAVTPTLTRSIELEWSELIENVADACDAFCAGIVVHYYKSNKARWIYTAGMPPDVIDAYEQSFSAERAWLAQEQYCREIGSVWLDDLPKASNGRDSSEIVSHWAPGADVRQQLTGVIEKKDQTVVCMVFYRTKKQGRFTNSDVDYVKTVLPIITSAWRIQRGARDSVTKAEVAAALLDQVALAAIVVDQAANLVSMNEGARRIVATGDGLVVRNGRLVAVGARGNARFQECLKAVVERATDGPSFPGVAFSLERRGGNTPLEIFVVPSRPTIAQTRSSGRLIAVLIRDPDAGFSPPPEWLATLYDLTRMEAQVAVWLAGGKTISEIAEAMHLSIHTIRSYVKDIFFKMGVRRQSDLVRRLMAGPGLMRAAVDGTIVPEAAAGTAVEKRAPAVSYG